MCSGFGRVGTRCCLIAVDPCCAAACHPGGRSGPTGSCERRVGSARASGDGRKVDHDPVWMIRCSDPFTSRPLPTWSAATRPASAYPRPLPPVALVGARYNAPDDHRSDRARLPHAGLDPAHRRASCHAAIGPPLRTGPLGISRSSSWWNSIGAIVPVAASKAWQSSKG